MILDLDALAKTELTRSPFEHLVVPRFVAESEQARIAAAFPRIEAGGSFPIGSLAFGEAFQALVDALLGPEIEAAVAAKFDIDLADRPRTLTVRGQSRRKDGRIHTDTSSKLVTLLLYLNPPWTAGAGRLRLLRSGHDLDDVITEVAPDDATLVAFRCRPNAWHGYRRFVGERRALQLNWVTDAEAAAGAQLRHRLSAWLKRA